MIPEQINRAFDTHVKPIVDKKQRLFVIIDAFDMKCGADSKTPSVRKSL
jgi:hypothetical protein